MNGHEQKNHHRVTADLSDRLHTVEEVLDGLVTKVEEDATAHGDLHAVTDRTVTARITTLNRERADEIATLTKRLDTHRKMIDALIAHNTSLARCGFWKRLWWVITGRTR